MSSDSVREKVNNLISTLNEGVQGVFTSEKYREFLEKMSKFHSYSASNCMLILLQNPKATRVAGYKAWQEKFNRHVKKGEKGIQILGYSVKKYKKTVDENNMECDSDVSGAEEKEFSSIRFFPVYVWDVSQTEGEPLDEITNKLTVSVDGYSILFDSISRVAGIPVRVEEINFSEANGYFNIGGNYIVVKEGLSESQTIETLIHELAHARLHNKGVADAKDKDSRTKEVEAESVAFVVCNYFGIDSSDYSFGYISSWSSGRDLKELKSSLDTIQKTASELITEISSEYSDALAELAELV